MPLSAVESFKGKFKSRVANQGDTAAQVWTVVMLPGESEDDAAEYIQTLFGVQVGSTYDESADSSTDATLYCHSVVPRFSANNIVEVTASFDCPPTGYYQPTVDPLDLPWSYEWKTVVETQPFDRDTANNAVLNSAYDPPRNPPTRTVTYKSLAIIRNEAYYDYATYKNYENCVNSDSITLTQPNGNDTVFGPGTIMCVSIEPGKAYTANDTFVPIVIKLEIYDQSEISLSDPFQLHLLDQGSSGYFDNGGTNTRGNIVNPDGSQVSTDVALDGHGGPLDPTLMISPAVSGGAAQPPVDTSLGTPPGATVEYSGDTAFRVVYLKYFCYLSIPFTSLLTGD